MRLDSPRWEEINPSGFAHERDGLRLLAEYLPDADPYHVWANVEFVATDGSINEVDALVLTASGLWVLELKHWQGIIEGDGQQWVRRVPGGRLLPSDNPYILANRKAKRLAGLIRHYAPGQPSVFVGAAVFLHAQNSLAKLDAVGRQHVYGPDNRSLPGPDGRTPSGLSSLKRFLLERPTNPIDPVRGRAIVEAVKAAKIRPSVEGRKIGGLLLHPKPFAEGTGWQDYLAGHAMDPEQVRRVRFYLTRNLSEEEAQAVQLAAKREFRFLTGMYHPGIARATDLIEHEWGPALIYEHDQRWERLDQWLAQRGPKLTLAQRLQLVQDLAEIMDYAHSRSLSHRALHPRAIFVRNPDAGRPELVVTDWQLGGRIPDVTRLTRLSGTTDGAALELFYDDETRRYQAPEATAAVRPRGTQLDVFALGALAYRIFTGQPPAGSAEELIAAVRESGLRLDAAVDGAPDRLVTLIYDATRGDPGQRLPSVTAFRDGLGEVWDAITAPEPEPVVDPLTAHAGDRLDGDLTVVSRLGAGATATALAVRTGDGRDLVLKVANDEQHAERLRAEARTLEKIKHWQVAALVQGPLVVGGRTALLLESAGVRTLAADLEPGRLQLELLERYGRDLLDIVTMLDGAGLWHRDIKPANLAARPRARDKEMHLCIFDFSLTEAPVENLTAGTVGYLDPFLGPPRRMRYDAAAERFAAAVTLYQMATGALPQWGDNANPSAVSVEVTLEASAFYPAIADRLVDFFSIALAREASDRYATSEEMTDAWRRIFVDIPEAVSPGAATLTRDSAVAELGLTVRAGSALERLGIATLGELLDYEPSALSRARGVPDATRKEIQAKVRELRPRFAGAAPVVEAPAAPTAQGIEALCALLLGDTKGRDRTALAVLLGQHATGDGRFLQWPSQKDAAQPDGLSQPQLSILMRRMVPRWLADPAIGQVRDEVVGLLGARGGVMTATEVAQALAVTRGSYTEEPKRTAQAVGLVRAAVEAELSRGGDARVDESRARQSGLVLIGLEPEDKTAANTARERLDYAIRLGREADTQAHRDPLPSTARVVQALRGIPLPDGMPALTDQRLVQLAAAASGGRADVSQQGQLYPVGLPAAAAIRLARGALIGQVLTVEAIQTRVRTRFPRAEPLPRRPALDALLAECDVPLLWDAARAVYTPPTHPSVPGTRPVTSLVPLGGEAEAREVDRRLADALAHKGYLAVSVSFRQLAEARRALLRLPGITEVDVTGLLLDTLRRPELDLPWQVILDADNGSPTDPDFRSLTDLVAHEVLPVLRKALESESGPVLVTEAAPLARYRQMGLLQELADASRQRPAARILLVPARRTDQPMLDDTPVPLTSPAQLLRLPDAWLTRERTPS